MAISDVYNEGDESDRLEPDEALCLGFIIGIKYTQRDCHAS